MLCPYCKSARIENDTPCPNCGAPSPLLQATSTQAIHTPWESQVPQISFKHAAVQGWQQPANAQGTIDTWTQSGTQANWQQNPSLAWQTQSWQQPAGIAQTASPAQELSPDQDKQSLLPVPYQGGAGENRQPTLALQLIPEHTVQQLLPSLPDIPEQVYVAPMYTKPRPLTPKYRVISGLLSVIIVSLLLCGGAGYYAKTSGKLDIVGQTFANIFGNGAPPNLQPTAGAQLPDPPMQTANDIGPAFNTIPSAATALDVYNGSNLARDNQNVFQPGQKFYVVFTVRAKENGTVTTKWFTNKQFFKILTYSGIKANENKNAVLGPIQYEQPTEGMVELYWNNKLAQRLYFVVR